MPPRSTLLLSASGLLPFLLFLLVAVRAPDRQPAMLQLALTYAALTSSFLGGVRWGAELHRAPERPVAWRLALAAVPSVLGLVALLPTLAVRHALALLTVTAIAQLLWDRQASREGLLPAWNARMRGGLTMLGLALLVAIVGQG